MGRWVGEGGDGWAAGWLAGDRSDWGQEPEGGCLGTPCFPTRGAGFLKGERGLKSSSKVK